MGKIKKEDKNSRKKSEILDDEDNIEKEIENLNSDIKSDIKYKLPSISLLKRSKSNSRLNFIPRYRGALYNLNNARVYAKISKRVFKLFSTIP